MAKDIPNISRVSMMAQQLLGSMYIKIDGLLCFIAHDWNNQWEERD